VTRSRANASVVERGNRRTQMDDKTNKSAAGVASRPKVVIERTYRAQVEELWDLWITK